MDKQALLGSLHSQLADLQKMVKDMAQSGSIHQLDKDMFKNKIIILYEDALKLQKVDDFPQTSVIPEPQKAKPTKVTETYVAQPEPEPKPEPKPEPEVKAEPLPQPEAVRAPEPVPTKPKIEAPKKVEEPATPAPVIEEKPSAAIDPETPSQGLTPLGDRMKPQKEAVNEIYGKAKASTKSTSNPQPISDILVAIGLNDRFLFTRELFSNNSELFKSTVSKLNNMASFDEATDYMSKEFSWSGLQMTVNQSKQNLYQKDPDRLTPRIQFLLFLRDSS